MIQIDGGGTSTWVVHVRTYPNTSVSRPSPTFNSSTPRQNGRHFADDIFICIFLTENVQISILLNFVARDSINNIPVFVQIMAWRRIGDKPLLSEPMLTRYTDAYMRHQCEMRLINLFNHVRRPVLFPCEMCAMLDKAVRWQGRLSPKSGEPSGIETIEQKSRCRCWPVGSPVGNQQAKLPNMILRRPCDICLFHFSAA